MANQVKNMLIGLFVVIASALIVGIILFLEPTVGDGKQSLVVRFSNINGINMGTRVLFAGKPIGEVVEIQQIPNAREQPTDDVGQVFFYQLILNIDSSVKVFNTDELSVQTSGLLGEKSIGIIPRAAPKGIKPRLITVEEPLYAESVDPLENAFNKLGELSEKVEETLDKTITWIDQNGEDLGSAIRSFDYAMGQINLTMEKANELDVMSSLHQSLTAFNNTATGIADTIETLKKQNAFVNLGETIQSIEKATKSIADGKGTIGKLLNDEDFYLRFNAILSKMDTLMNDVNHYGVLFNLNKQWQRTRTKRITALNALSTPKNFKNYFEKEVDLINTSISRISMCIENAQNTSNNEEILRSTPFKRDFLELMRQVEELSNNLKLYNQQLMDSGE